MGNGGPVAVGRFQYPHQFDQHGRRCGVVAGLLQECGGGLILGFIVPQQEAGANVGIQGNHQACFEASSLAFARALRAARISSSDVGARPARWRMPPTSSTVACLTLAAGTRRRLLPSSRMTNSTPGCRWCESRIDLGITICPLLDIFTVATLGLCSVRRSGKTDDSPTGVEMSIVREGLLDPSGNV